MLSEVLQPIPRRESVTENCNGHYSLFTISDLRVHSLALPFLLWNVSTTSAITKNNKALKPAGLVSKMTYCYWGHSPPLLPPNGDQPCCHELLNCSSSNRRPLLHPWKHLTALRCATTLCAFLSFEVPSILPLLSQNRSFF